MKNVSKQLQFLFQLAKTNAVMSRRFSSQGLGFSDMMVLYAVNQKPDGKIRRVDLADELGLTASGVTRLLLPLEKIGVIKREVNARDARVSYTVLTNSGKELLANSIVSAEEFCEDNFPHGSAKKMEEVTTLLSSIRF